MGVGQYAALVGALKGILKRKNITYAQLGERIGMSESGVKKLLTAADGSVNRLEEICGVLGMTLLDLVQAATEDLPAQEFRIPESVQEYFVAQMDCFHLYWKLVYEDRTLEEAARDLGMTRAVAMRHLRQLDRFGLLALGPEDRIKLPKRGHVVWVGEGPLMAYLRRKWSQSLLDQAVGTVDADHHHLSLRYLRLTPGSRADLVRAVQDLNREFGSRSLRERLIQADKDLVEVRMLTAIAPGSFVAAEAP